MQSWKIRVELINEDESVVVEQSGKYTSTRPQNESISLDMGYVVLMLMASGQICGLSSFKESVEAFAEAE